MVRPEGRRPRARTKRRREANIEMSLKGKLWESMEWIYHAQEHKSRALVDKIINLTF